MISVDEFRESYINEDIKAAAVNTSTYPIEVFIDSAVDILQNDYCLISGMEHCYYEFNKGTKAYRNMRIDAAYFKTRGHHHIEERGTHHIKRTVGTSFQNDFLR